MQVDEAKSDVEAPRTRGDGVARVYAALKRDILDMTLGPGEPLDEVSLSARFALSRTPVREALVRLVAEGLATTLPNRSTIVSTVDYARLPAYLDALALMYRATTRLAATRRHRADFAAIREHQARFADAVEAADAPAMIETNRAFHLAIAEAGGNPYYNELFARLLDEGTRLLRIYYATFHDRLPKIYVQEHEDIVAAVEAGDAEWADALAARHAHQIAEQLKSFLSPKLGLRISLATAPAARAQADVVCNDSGL